MNIEGRRAGNRSTIGGKVTNVGQGTEDGGKNVGSWGTYNEPRDTKGEFTFDGQPMNRKLCVWEKNVSRGTTIK